MACIFRTFIAVLLFSSFISSGISLCQDQPQTCDSSNLLCRNGIRLKSSYCYGQEWTLEGWEDGYCENNNDRDFTSFKEFDSCFRTRYKFLVDHEHRFVPQSFHGNSVELGYITAADPSYASSIFYNTTAKEERFCWIIHDLDMPLRAVRHAELAMLVVAAPINDIAALLLGALGRSDGWTMDMDTERLENRALNSVCEAGNTEEGCQGRKVCGKIWYQRPGDNVKVERGYQRLWWLPEAPRIPEV